MNAVRLNAVRPLLSFRRFPLAFLSLYLSLSLSQLFSSFFVAWLQQLLSRTPQPRRDAIQPPWRHTQPPSAATHTPSNTMITRVHTSSTRHHDYTRTHNDYTTTMNCTNNDSWAATSLSPVVLGLFGGCLRHVSFQRFATLPSYRPNSWRLRVMHVTSTSYHHYYPVLTYPVLSTTHPLQPVLSSCTDKG